MPGGSHICRPKSHYDEHSVPFPLAKPLQAAKLLNRGSTIMKKTQRLQFFDEVDESAGDGTTEEESGKENDGIDYEIN